MSSDFLLNIIRKLDRIPCDLAEIKSRFLPVHQVRNETIVDFDKNCSQPVSEKLFEQTDRIPTVKKPSLFDENTGTTVAMSARGSTAPTPSPSTRPRFRRQSKFDEAELPSGQSTDFEGITVECRTDTVDSCSADMALTSKLQQWLSDRVQSAVNSRKNGQNHEESATVSTPTNEFQSPHEPSHSQPATEVGSPHLGSRASTAIGKFVSTIGKAASRSRLIVVAGLSGSNEPSPANTPTSEATYSLQPVDQPSFAAAQSSSTSSTLEFHAESSQTASHSSNERDHTDMDPSNYRLSERRRSFRKAHTADSILQQDPSDDDQQSDDQPSDLPCVAQSAVNVRRSHMLAGCGSGQINSKHSMSVDNSPMLPRRHAPPPLKKLDSLADHTGHLAVPFSHELLSRGLPQRGSRSSDSRSSLSSSPVGSTSPPPMNSRSPSGSGRYGSPPPFGSPPPSFEAVVAQQAVSTEHEPAVRRTSVQALNTRESSKISITGYDGFVQLNQYKLKHEIGRGSYGIVKLAYNLEDDNYYAMKIMSKSKLAKKAQFLRRVAMRKNTKISEEDPLERLYKEIAVLKKLIHPNVVRLMEVLDDPEEDYLYMVFELVENREVIEIPTDEPFDESTARGYFRDVLQGLEYLHYQKIVHRDIKPSNLLLSVTGRIKIADFGVSREFGADDALLTNTVGTPAFQPPEAFDCGQGKSYSGRAMDMWGIGVTLYCFVCGQLPFCADGGRKALHDVIMMQAVQFPDRPSLCDDLKDLIERLLEKDARRRMTLAVAKEHVWVTQHGLNPMPKLLENCIQITVTDDEISNVVRHIPRLATLILVKTILRRKTFKHPYISSESNSLEDFQQQPTALSRSSSSTPSQTSSNN